LYPADEKPLLVWDGDCGFCTTWVNRLERILPVFPRHSPWQWLDLDQLGLSADDVRDYAWIVTPGRQVAGHLAFAAILRMQPHIALRFLGHLIETSPYSWIAALGYRLVAANRHRLPGGTPACALPRA
jgi:predicted DCC family thiol-disulfide oxidoreductase YuxK